MSTGELAEASWLRRGAVWLHLSMCRHCRAFRRQISQLTRLARADSLLVEREPPPDFEARIADRLKE
jgi:hypothetical protein